MLGEHNVSNALAAISVSSLLNVDYEKIYDSFSNFEGINRRFDIHISNNKVVYVDDYAHHPKEIRSTICGILSSFPQRKLTVIFQPHLYTRTRDFANDFANSLSEADKLILLDIYPAREKPIKGINSQMLLDLCSNDCKMILDKKELLNHIKRNENDLVMTLGAGDISDLVAPIKRILN